MSASGLGQMELCCRVGPSRRAVWRSALARPAEQRPACRSRHGAGGWLPGAEDLDTLRPHVCTSIAGTCMAVLRRERPAPLCRAASTSSYGRISHGPQPRSAATDRSAGRQVRPQLRMPGTGTGSWLVAVTGRPAVYVRHGHPSRRAIQGFDGVDRAAQVGGVPEAVGFT
jgi:hypothetical protein